MSNYHVEKSAECGKECMINVSLNLMLTGYKQISITSAMLTVADILLWIVCFLPVPSTQVIFSLIVRRLVPLIYFFFFIMFLVIVVVFLFCIQTTNCPQHTIFFLLCFLKIGFSNGIFITLSGEKKEKKVFSV